MKIKIIEDYSDLELDRIVKVGEQLEVTNQRGKQIIDKNFAVALEITNEDLEDNKDDSEDELNKMSEDELRAKAKELKISGYHNTGLDKLKDKIRKVISE